MNINMRFTKKDREKMRKTLTFTGKILGLNLKLLAICSFSIGCFTKESYDKNKKEQLAILKEIKSLEKNPEKLFFPVFIPLIADIITIKKLKKHNIYVKYEIRTDGSISRTLISKKTAQKYFERINEFNNGPEHVNCKCSIK